MIYRQMLYFGIIFGLLSACESQHDKSQDNKEADFSTSDASELFFNNVRAIYYDLESQENTKLRIYRIKTRAKDEDHPIVNLALVNNWRYDEAYLLIELGGLIKQKKEVEIQWQSPNSDKAGTYVFNVKGNKSAHLKFAGELYESIRQDHQLHHKHRGESLPILHSARERQAFKTSIEDYYRLIGVL